MLHSSDWIVLEFTVFLPLLKLTYPAFATICKKGVFVGPLPHTFADFWRMVWEQQVLLVVMLTRVMERGRKKCGQYWPLQEETSVQYGNYIITNQAVETYNDYIQTQILLTHKIVSPS